MTLGGKRGRDRIKRKGWGEKRLPAQHGRKDEEEGRSEREGSDAAAAREGVGQGNGRDGTRGWHLNGDVLYVEPSRQNDSSSKAASASTTKRQKLLKGKSIRIFVSSLF